MKQGNYRARGGKCDQRRLAVPKGYVCRTFFQAQINVGIEPRKLIFGETDYSFFGVSVQSLPVCLNT